MRDSKVLEDLQVIFGRVAPLVDALGVDWAHEGDELVGNDPVEVSVLDLLVVLVLLVVKIFELVPPVAYCDFEPFQTVENSAVVGTVTVAGISERSKLVLIGRKCFPDYLG